LVFLSALISQVEDVWVVAVLSHLSV